MFLVNQLDCGEYWSRGNFHGKYWLSIYVERVFIEYLFFFSHGVRETVAFDNAAYTKDADESFDAAETSFNSNNSTEECPKWAKGYDRARQLYERNRNVPAGRLFDFHNPGGETSQI